MAGRESQPRRFLFCGDVQGRFAQLRDRLNKLHGSKAGPFDAAICSGSFFEAGQGAKDSIQSLKDVSASFALPIYFITGSERENKDVRSVLPVDGGEIAPNCHYLGDAGIADVLGLTVAFVSGAEHPNAPVAGRQESRESAASPVAVDTDESAGQEYQTGHDSITIKPPTLPSSLGVKEHDACVGALAARMEKAADDADREEASKSTETATTSDSNAKSAKRPWRRPAQPIDLFLSAEWPAGFHLGVPSDALPSAQDLRLQPDELGPVPPSVEAVSAASDSTQAVPGSELAARAEAEAEAGAGLDVGVADQPGMSPGTGASAPAPDVVPPELPPPLASLRACERVGSSRVASLVRALRPRYHLCSGGTDTHYQRPPFVHAGTASPQDAAVSGYCRMIALAAIPAPGLSLPGASLDGAAAAAPAKRGKKGRWIHALQLGTCSSEAVGTVVAPPGSTPSPFVPQMLMIPGLGPLVPQGGGLGQGEWTGPRHSQAGAGAGTGWEDGIGIGRGSDSNTRPGRHVAADELALRPGADQFFFSQGRQKGGPGGGGRKREREPGTEGGDGIGLGNTGDPGSKRPRHAIDAATIAGVSGVRMMAGGLVAGGKRRLPPGAVSDCWFCTSSPSFQARLVCSIGDDSLLTLPRGPISETHCLVVPVPHVVSLAASPADVSTEMRRYMQSLRQWHRAAGRRLVAFERVVQTMGSHHAHVQTVGVPVSAAEGAVELFESKGRKLGMSFVRLSQGQSLAHAAGGDQYMSVEVDGDLGEGFGAEAMSAGSASGASGSDSGKGLLPPMTRLFYKVQRGVKLPYQFGREVCCELLAVPGRRHWKDCLQSEEEEEEAAGVFRESFEPFDFTM